MGEPRAAAWIGARADPDIAHVCARRHAASGHPDRSHSKSIAFEKVTGSGADRFEKTLERFRAPMPMMMWSFCRLPASV